MSEHTGYQWMVVDIRFDGDMKSATGIQSDQATSQLDDYMKTREAWVTPDGQMRSTIDYDTSNLIFKNLTSRFDHVRKLTANQKQKLQHLRMGGL